MILIPFEDYFFPNTREWRSEMDRDFNVCIHKEFVLDVVDRHDNNFRSCKELIEVFHILKGKILKDGIACLSYTKKS